MPSFLIKGALRALNPIRMALGIPRNTVFASWLKQGETMLIKARTVLYCTLVLNIMLDISDSSIKKKTSVLFKLKQNTAGLYVQHGTKPPLAL